MSKGGDRGGEGQASPIVIADHPVVIADPIGNLLPPPGLCPFGNTYRHLKR